MLTRLFIPACAFLMLIVGCEMPRFGVDPQLWEMTCYKRDGSVCVARRTTKDVAAGRFRPAIRFFTTLDPCWYACKGAESELIATVEERKAMADRIVRVYDASGALVLEVPGHSWQHVALTDDGSRVGMVGGDGTVAWQDIADKGSYRSVRLPDEEPYAYSMARCAWLGNHLIVGCDKKDKTYIVQAEGTYQRSPATGYFMSVREDGPVFATRPYTSFQLLDAQGKSISPLVRAGHDYATLIAVAPCAHYLVFHRPPPGIWHVPGKVIIRDLWSGAERVWQSPVRGYQVGSWTSIPVER